MKDWIPAFAGMTEGGGQDGLTILSSSRMRGPIRCGKDKGWIPAFAESTLRIGQKGSGGNDEAQWE